MSIVCVFMVVCGCERERDNVGIFWGYYEVKLVTYFCKGSEFSGVQHENQLPNTQKRRPRRELLQRDGEMYESWSGNTF